MRHAAPLSRLPALPRPVLRAAAAAAFVAAAGAAQAASFQVTYGAPGAQSADRSALCATFGQGACVVGVETFDARPLGAGQGFTTSFGTGGVITGAYKGVEIAPAGVYGGAGGGGNYAVTYGSSGYQVSLSTTLPGGINYFGYWLSALDAGNQVAFYDGATEVYRFTPTDLIALVGGCPNASNAYCGNPTPAFQGQVKHEPFVFVNFFDTSGTFDRIVFSEKPQSGGYESDNHTVGYVTGLSGTPVNPVPEPASFALLGLGLAGLGVARRRGWGKAA